MSIIKRTLTGESSVNVAGPTGGGGIIMQPVIPPVVSEDCPSCGGGGDCVPDIYTPQWVAVNRPINNVLSFQGTSITYDLNASPPTGARPPSYGGLFDLSKSYASRAQLCCDDISWDVVISGPGVPSTDISYHVVDGLLIIYKIISEFQNTTLTATPTVCGTELSPLIYNIIGPS